jgi:SAM-dependent methyltransferase
MTSGEYLLDNRATHAEQRFAALSAQFDPVTFQHVTNLGIATGWRCWEVGAGGPLVPRWLADRVGPTGQVVATDIDTRWIDDGLGPGVQVRQHDVVTDDPPDTGFDLVHARLVLVHLPARDTALRRMVSSLRPGGWLLIEDFDVALQPHAHLDPHEPEHHLANKLREGFLALLAQRGVDLEYGRKLPRLLAEHGLTDIAADGYLSVTRPAAAALDAANLAQVGDALVAQGRATAEEVQQFLAAVTGGLGLASPPLVGAWGRRPG